MTKREIMKKAIEELKRMDRIRKTYAKENNYDGVRYINHDIRASIDMLWHIGIINLDKDRYLLKCFGL